MKHLESLEQPMAQCEPCFPVYRMCLLMVVMHVSSIHGDSGDRRSWENRTWLQMQSKEQSAGDTDVLFA